MTVPSTTPGRAERLYREHSRALLAHVRRRDPRLADDVVAETFAVAVRRADEIPAGHEYPWLCVVADNVLRNQWRSQRRVSALAEALQPHTREAESPADLPVIGEALSTLPERERALLTMAAFEGLTPREAAERLGIPYGSARNSMVRGRRTLLVRLAALGVVVAGVVAAVVFLARPGGPVPQLSTPARSFADALRTSRLVEQVVDVRATPRAAAHRITLTTDVSSGRREALLPDGRRATASADGSLAVPSAASANGAPFHRDLDVLDVITVANVQSILDQAAQADRAAAGSGAAQTTAAPRSPITGTVRGADGHRYDVEVFLSADGARPVRLRVRRAGRAAWQADIEVRHWHLEPAAGAATGAAPGPTTAKSPTSSSTPAGSLHGAAGSAGSTGNDVARVHAGAGDGSDGRSSSSSTAGANPATHGSTQRAGREQRELPPMPAAYAGVTGAVLWTAAEQDLGGGATASSQTWTELGGGSRARSIVATFAAGAPEATEDVRWSTPSLLASAPYPASQGSPSITLDCRATAPPQVNRDAIALAEAVTAARAQLTTGGSLPVGATVDGHVTVSVPVSAGGLTALLLDATSGAVLEGLPAVGSPLRYTVWSVVPAGGSAARLAQPLPTDAAVTPATGCPSGNAP